MRDKRRRHIDVVVTRTPDEDEKQTLQEWYLFAELLVAFGDGISRKRWIQYGNLLDSIPTVGSYFRHRLATSSKFDNY